MKNKLILFVLAVVFVLHGCTSSVMQDTPPPSLVPMSFDYVPPVEGVTKSNDITFSILNPHYVSSFTESNIDPYKTFANNMAKDFAEMLTARGYPYRGPFLNYDLMVYNDKKITDMVIEPEIEIQMTGNYLKSKRKIHVLSTDFANEYYCDGDVTITSKLNLSFAEPFTKTKIWVKSIEVDPVTFHLKSYYAYPTMDIPVNDPLVWNSVVENLKNIYQYIMNTAWNHLEPVELLQKKDEASEIKQNSGFMKN